MDGDNINALAFSNAEVEPKSRMKVSFVQPDIFAAPDEDDSSDDVEPPPQVEEVDATDIIQTNSKNISARPRSSKQALMPSKADLTRMVWILLV